MQPSIEGFVAPVRGFAEEGTTTAPFDTVVLNELDRFHLAIEVIEITKLQSSALNRHRNSPES